MIKPFRCPLVRNIKYGLSIFFIGLSLPTLAQSLRPALKANALYSLEPTFWRGIQNIEGNINQIFNHQGTHISGASLGFSLKTNLPIVNLYLMPELYYTRFQSIEVPHSGIRFSDNRIDFPVLIGYNLLGDNLSLFTGPVVSFNVSRDRGYNFEKNISKNLSMKYQFGAEAEFSRIIINLRFEGAFTRTQQSFINAQSGIKIQNENTQKMLILGLGYSL